MRARLKRGYDAFQADGERIARRLAAALRDIPFAVRHAVAATSRSSGLMTAMAGLLITCTYTIVVFSDACPSSVCTCRTSYPASSRCVAKLWRKVWHDTRL